MKEGEKAFQNLNDFDEEMMKIMSLSFLVLLRTLKIVGQLFVNCYLAG